MPVLLVFGVDLVAVIVALAALLVLIALWVFVKPIAVALNHVPIPFVNVGDVLTKWLESAMKSVVGLFDSIVHGFGHVVWALGVGMWHLTLQTVKAIQDAKQTALKGLNFALGLESTLFAELGSASLRLEQEVAAGIATAEAEAQSALNLALSTVVGPLASDLARVESEAVRALGEADSAIASIPSDVAGAIAQAEAAFRTQIADVQSEAVRLFGQAEAGIQVLTDEVLGIPQAITGEITSITEAEIAEALAVAGVAAIPGLLTQVQAITTEVTTCLDPLCETVTPNAGRLGNLGNLFRNLEDLGLEAFFIALAAEAVHDPEAVARDVTTVMEDVGNPVLSGFRDLIGV